MIIDANQLPKNNSITADVCIIGSGPAGLSIAFSLEQAGQKVCILEAGGLEPEKESQDLCRVTQSGVPCFDPGQRRVFALGGTSWLWSGWCRPFDEIDFQDRPWVPNSGWPVSYSSVAKYYDQAGRFLGLPDTRFSPELLSSLTGRKPWELSDQALETRFFRVLRPATRLGQTQVEYVRRSEQITVITHAVATDLAFDPSHQRVEAVEFLNRRRIPFRIKARNTVLALGAIDNPRFLLNVERKHRTRGLKLSPALGRYFMLRPHARAGKSDLNVANPASMDLYDHSADHIVSRIFLSPYGQEKFRMLRYNVSFTQNSSFQKAALIMMGAGAVTPQNRREFIKKIGLGLAGVSLAGCATVPQIAANGMFLQHTTENAPNHESRIKISHEVDAMGELRADVDWQPTELDFKTLYGGASKVSHRLNQWNRIRTNLDSFGEQNPNAPPDNHQGSPGHYVGTTRMGLDRETSVVDANCKIHQIDNVYVAGCSVFPTSGNGTPTLTMVAVALKLADHLKHRG